MKKISIILALFCGLCAFAQDTDDSYISVSVTASAPETSQAIESLSKEQIDEIHPTDIIDVLNKGLGISVQRNGTYGNVASVNMRGFGSGRIAFLINGVPVNSAQNGSFDVFSIDVSSIERIEVIKGGSDSKYNVSGAMGGVINIITLKNSARGFSLKTHIENTGYMPGTYIARHTSAITSLSLLSLIDTQKIGINLGYGFKNSSLNVDLFGVRAKNEFIFLDEYDDYRLRFGNEVYDTGVNAVYTQNLRDNSSIIGSFNFYAGDKNIPESNVGAVINKQKDLNFKESIVLDLKAVTDTLDTEAFISHSFDNMNFETSEHKLNTLSLTNRWKWYPLDMVFFTFAGDYRFSHLDSTDIGKVHRNDIGLSLMAEWYPLDVLSVIPSVKLLIQDDSVVPVPKIGFLFTPTNSLVLKHNWFRVFKFPNFNDVYWNGAGGVGNKDLKPEDGVGTDIIFEYAKEGWFSSESSVYATYQKNSIHWRPLSGTTWTPKNVGEAFLWGCDISLKSDFTDKFTLSANYSLLLSYILTEGYTFESKVRMPYMPMHRFGVSIDVPWSTGKFTLSGSYEGESYNTDYKLDDELGAYFLLDATVNQKIGKNFTVYAAVNNILNQDYVQVEGYPMPKLNFKIGLSYTM